MSLDVAGLADTSGLDDGAVYSRLIAAGQSMSADLKRDPATMAYGLDSGYRMRPHLRTISDSMTPLLTLETDRLLILTPPQVGKSTTVAEWGPVWWFANRPADGIAIASYGLDLALDRSKGVRERVQEYGPDFDLFTKPGSEAAHDWELTSGGHLRAIGVGGGLSGFSANLLLIDDPHKDRAEVESPRMRNAVHDWYSSVGLKRLQPDMGVVVIIMTRWHVDDLAGRRLKEEGRVEEGGRWKVVHLPAFADPKFGVDPLGREPGEPLTHPKVPTRDTIKLRAWWEDMKKTSIVRDWHSLAQGDPQPTQGAIVSDELLRMIRDTTTPVEAQKVGVAIDPSGGGRDTAGIIGGFLGDDNRLWITHDWSGVMSSALWSEKACLLAYQTGAALFFIETNYGGDQAVLALTNAWANLQKATPERGPKIPVEAFMPQVKVVRAKQGKLLRAEPIAQQMIMDRVRLRGLFVDLEREWATWMPTDPLSPGRIDASVYLAYGLLPLPVLGKATSDGLLTMSNVDLTRSLRP